MLIEEYSINFIRCFEKLKPLIVVLRPPLTEPYIENIIELIKVFPDSTDINPLALDADFLNFVEHIDLLNNSFENKEHIAKFLDQRKTTRCYRILLTISVTVAEDESKHHFQPQWTIKD